MLGGWEGRRTGHASWAPTETMMGTMHPASSDPWDVVPSAMDRQLDDRLMLGGGEGRRTGRID